MENIENTKELKPVLQLKNVSVSYNPGTFAVKKVSTDIYPNTITAIMGPSGCGKSTLLRAINRMHDLYSNIKTTGEIILKGKDILTMDSMEVRRLAGMVFQQPNPFPTMSIYENVLAGYKLNGIRLSKKEKDEIVEPAYANYMAFAISAGAVIRTIPSDMESNFALPEIEEFEKLINERTKGILICNPNNPTGYVYTPQEMEKIRLLVKKYNLYLFSDEVYREFIYNDTPYISACHLEGIEENVVLIDSVSKRYSECGIRIGALITKNIKLHDTVMKFCQARLSPPLIGQIAANASLSEDSSYMQRNFKEYKSRRDFLIDRLNKIPGVYSPMPQGAFYTLARLPIDDADKFCAWCLSDFRYEGQTIFMAPATGFYVTPGLGTNEVRIAYVLNTEDLDKALTVLEKALEEYKNVCM
jgi:aspartate aminotransferase